MQTIKYISNTFIKQSDSKIKKIIFFLATFISTGCFVGKTKYAPGTFGSLLAILFCPVYVKMSISWQLTIFGLLLAAGTLATHLYLIKINDLKKDPKEVVIDEIVAIFLITLLAQIIVPANTLNWKHFLSIFVLFRVFDISKPYPICWIDKNIHGAKGIMLDDILAAIASWLIFVIAYA